MSGINRKKVNLMEGFVRTFEGSFPPHVRLLMIPALVGTLNGADFMMLWAELSKLIQPDPLSQHRAEETLSMVERWVKENADLKLAHDLAKSGDVVTPE